MDASMSEYIQMMVAAGRKKFARKSVEIDEDRAELRRQRNELLDELKDSRERINKLEKQLTRTERAAVLDYVEENPGAELGDIIQHILNTTAGRITKMVADLEGSELFVTDVGEYYMDNGVGTND